MKINKKINKGMTIIEILVVISIIVILTAVIVPNFSQFRKQQALQNTTVDIVSLLDEARSNTISSKNSTTYGVHFESDRAVLFDGDTFVENVLNKEINFDSSIEIPSSGGISLNGGGDDVIFTRIIGETSQYGTIIIRLTSDYTQQETITINKVGVISVN